MFRYIGIEEYELKNKTELINNIERDTADSFIYQLYRLMPYGERNLEKVYRLYTDHRASLTLTPLQASTIISFLGWVEHAATPAINLMVLENELKYQQPSNYPQNVWSRIFISLSNANNQAVMDLLLKHCIVKPSLFMLEASRQYAEKWRNTAMSTYLASIENTLKFECFKESYLYLKKQMRRHDTTALLVAFSHLDDQMFIDIFHHVACEKDISLHQIGLFTVELVRRLKSIQEQADSQSMTSTNMKDIIHFIIEHVDNPELLLPLASFSINTKLYYTAKILTSTVNKLEITTVSEAMLHMIASISSDLKKAMSTLSNAASLADIRRDLGELEKKFLELQRRDLLSRSPHHLFAAKADTETRLTARDDLTVSLVGTRISAATPANPRIFGTAVQLTPMDTSISAAAAPPVYKS